MFKNPATHKSCSDKSSTMKDSKCLLLLMAVLADSILVFDRIASNVNNKTTGIKFDIFNDGVHESFLNVTIEHKFDVVQMKMLVKVNLPIDKRDKTYQREILQTNVDVEKLFKGVTGNFVMQAFMEKYLDCIDFEPKFPWLAGFQHITNFSVSDKYLPVAILGGLGVPMSFLVEIRVMEKLAGKKSFSYCMTLRFYGKFHGK